MNEAKMRFTPGQRRATKALITFGKAHGLPQFWTEQLSSCLSALEYKDVSGVTSVVQLLRRGGMGSFLDWVPQVASNEEDTEYTETLWFALYGYWLEMMRPFKEAENV
jgi:hypothetical protein